MTRTIPTYAKSEQYRTIAKILLSKGFTTVEALAWFKQNKYIVNNIKYNAVQVVILMELWGEISNAIKDGKVKATKARGLEFPTAK